MDQHYRFTYRGIKIDPYRIMEVYGITHPAHQHALKKLLRAGRSIKELGQDIDEVILSLTRWKEMLNEDGVTEAKETDQARIDDASRPKQAKPRDSQQPERDGRGPKSGAFKKKYPGTQAEAFDLLQKRQRLSSPGRDTEGDPIRQRKKSTAKIKTARRSVSSWVDTKR